MWKFEGSTEKEVEFPMGVMPFHGIFKGKALFCPEFLRVM